MADGKRLHAAGAVRLLQQPAPGLALAIPLQLHWAECVWELPLLEVLVHLAARHAWPAPVQVPQLGLRCMPVWAPTCSCTGQNACGCSEMLCSPPPATILPGLFRC